MSDANDTWGTGTYRETALERGRPTDPCECETCDCPLHTYEDDERCIWCRNGDHAAARTDGGYPWNVRVDLGGVTFDGPGMRTELEAQTIKSAVEGSEPIDGVEVFRQ